MDVKFLIEAQHDIYGRLSRCEDNLKKMGASNITLSAVEARITIIDNVWRKVESQHDLIRAGLKDKYNESEYAASDFIDTIESTYIMQRSVLHEYADKLRALPPVSRNQDVEYAVKTSLPRIKLQIFSGSYEEWPSFRDLFSSVVENSAISDVERFHSDRESRERLNI